MDTLKKHWPTVAVSVAAVALGLYVYASTRKETNKLFDSEGNFMPHKGSDWPEIRRIIGLEMNPV